MAAIAAVVVLLSLSCLTIGSPVQVTVLSTDKEAAPGGFITHVFAVTNTGSDPDTYTLDFDAPVGWSVLGAPSSIALLPGEESTLFVTLTIPSGTQAGAYDTTLVATSDTDANDTDTAEAATRISPSNEVQILPPVAASVAPGGAITYEFEIVNRGNAQDSYDLAVASSLGLPLAMSDTSIQLAPQERLAVSIQLTVPEVTPAGRDVLTLTVSSTLYADVSAQSTIFTTILPPSPSAIGGSLVETLASRFRLTMTKDVLGDTFDSRMTFSTSGRVNSGYFSAFVSASDPLGPNAVTADSFSMLYRLRPSTFALGNTSKRLTDLVSLSCEGASLEIDADTYRVVFIGGGYSDETRAAGHVALGPDEANLGLAYRGVRSDTVQESLWSATAAAEPFDDWQIRAEGALGLDGPLTSRAFFFNSRINTPGYYLNTDAYSVGTNFPGSLADSEGISLSQRLRLDVLSLAVSLSHEHNNVIADPLEATLINDELGFNLATNFLEDGPTVTTTVDFEWDRYPDLSEKNEIDTLLGFSITESAGVFPYALTGKIADQIDHVFETHYRTSTFSEGVGLSIDSFYFFLTLTQEKHVDLVTDEVLSSAADVSVRFRPQGTIHEASINLGNTEDDFDLSAALYIRFMEDLDLILSGSIAWDRADASDISFGWGITINADLALPMPFFVTKGRLEGHVFIDRNGNGVYDSGEPPAAGVIVTANRTEVSTDQTGAFRFPPSYPGEFSLSVRQLPIDATLAAPIADTLAAGETKTVYVPLAPLLSLTGTLFDDVDRDGDYNEDEGGFSQVRILVEGEGLSRDAYTDLRGAFSVRDLRLGTYAVRIDQTTLPARFVFTTDETASVVIDGGTSAPVLLGGYIQPREVIITFQPPTADFFVEPDPAIAGAPAILDGTFSFDFDGEIVAYAWDFDGDGEIDSTEPIPEIVFPSPGTYDVTLTVTDNGGNSDTITYSVTVE